MDSSKGPGVYSTCQVWPEFCVSCWTRWDNDSSCTYTWRRWVIMPPRDNKILNVSLRRQRGPVVSLWDSQSSGPGFESRSDHYLDLFHGSPELKIFNHACKQPTGLPASDQLGFLTMLQYVQLELFVSLSCLLGSANTCALNTAKGKYTS